ncbi:MAG: hypothetical protein Kow0032_03220 [Methyloligellaceae bacterium]
MASDPITDAEPTFPPLLHGEGIAGAGSIFAEACRRAAEGRAGAGDVFWGRDTALLEVAIVLEPDVGMETAVQMLPVAMVAIGDSLGALTPPQVGVTFIWPDTVCINGAPAGQFRAAISPAADAGGIPDWMVIALELRHRRGPGDPEPGETPDITWLAEEGGGELTRSQIIESFARHFLTWLHNWNEDGFKPVHASWLYRAEHRDQKVTLEHGGETVSGDFLGLDDSGNLLLKDSAGETRALHLTSCFPVHSAQATGS